MRRAFVITVFVLGMCFLVYRKMTSVAPNVDGPVPPAPFVTPLPVKAVSKPKKESTFSKMISPNVEQRLEGNQVRFHVENGFAIAFGDVLLGKPDDPQITEGIYDGAAPLLWDRGEIPYAISADLPNPERVEAAIQYFREHTALSFVRFTGQPDAIVFEPGPLHCYSLLGKAGGQQPIKLAANCRWPEIAHEIMHALGFVHEQSRTDRDAYLDIKWENIDPKFHDQFAMVPESYMEATTGSPFDYRSAMLYHTDAFALKPGLVTMLPKGSFQIDPIPQGLSDGDIQRVNRLYQR